MDRLPTALLGLGRWGQNYLRLLRDHPALRLVAAIDPSSEARAAAAQVAPGVPTWATTDGLADVGARAVILATPAETHADLVQFACTLGLHVLVEKPLATRAAEADALAVPSAIVVMVGHVVLHVPVIARTLAEVGRLGSPRSTEHVRVSTGARFSVEDPIWALGPHDVALSLRMMGRAPIAVRARREGASIVAAARFSNGAESRFRFSRSGQAPLRRVDVAGDDYHLTADEASGRLISRSPAGSRDELVAGELTPLDLECRQFVQCVLGQTRPLEPLSDAIANVHVLEAMVRSRDEGGGWIALDLERPSSRSRAMNAAAFAAPD
jgi:UDP-2-acetamido-3-amino-2,3-dideoxy-glucuronate N-acetyltransferase